MSDAIRAVSSEFTAALARAVPTAPTSSFGTARSDAASGIGATGVAGIGEGVGRVQGKGFADVLGDAITDARQMERTSDHMADRFAAGDPTVGLHEVMIATEKTGIAVRFAVTLKNRALEAYRELMGTQL